jgi:phenylpropionate dioxygenase-like ring-hydroxylating dioxygenase large terminal subunit
MDISTAMNGADATHVRGDRMNGERYWSREFARAEWEHMWKKVWHIAGRENEIPLSGDFLVHDFMHESVIVIRQDDGSLRGFYNSCGHRGHRLAWESSSIERFTCPYHGWVWGKDGILQDLPDPTDFPQGNPCGRLSLREVRCATWGGFVWYAMSPAAPSFEEYLGPVLHHYDNFPLDTLVRVFQIKIELDTNWKFAPENFSESYHTRTAHPQVPAFCDQDHWNARLEMFREGHGRTIQPFRPSLRDSPDTDPHPFDEVLGRWLLDPAAYPDFETKVLQGWRDLASAKRALGPQQGRAYYAKLSDGELTESIHSTIFPNVTLTFGPDEIYFQRTEPHPDDPSKCTFDLWCMVFPVEGQEMTETPMVGSERLPVREAPPLRRAFDRGRGVPELHGGVVIQDLMLAEGQQRGVRSQGYRDGYLAGQETRVRFFNEVLNDYLEGRR